MRGREGNGRGRPSGFAPPEKFPSYATGRQTGFGVLMSSGRATNVKILKKYYGPSPILLWSK